ncbi:PTS sugar transporter subunit IIC, partial [Lactobacillus sp. XV13L]|nr:PTS sugar transporter subunit IIC [Lactobacillus sp. XV13L]
VLGDLQQGIILGASLELISMGFVAIGAAGPPNMQIGSVIATAFVILSHANTQTALAIALPIAVAAQFLDILMRMIMAQFGHMADKAIIHDNFKRAQHIHVYWAFALNAILYFGLIFITIYFGANSVKTIVDMIPKVITHGLTVAGNLLSALGFAMLLSTMLNKKLFLYFLFGFLIVAYLKVDLIGVTLFSIILAFIMDKVSYSSKKEANNENS